MTFLIFLKYETFKQTRKQKEKSSKVSKAPPVDRPDSEIQAVRSKYHIFL